MSTSNPTGCCFDGSECGGCPAGAPATYHMDLPGVTNGTIGCSGCDGLSSLDLDFSHRTSFVCIWLGSVPISCTNPLFDIIAEVTFAIRHEANPDEPFPRATLTISFQSQFHVWDNVDEFGFLYEFDCLGSNVLRNGFTSGDGRCKFGFPSPPQPITIAPL